MHDNAGATSAVASGRAWRLRGAAAAFGLATLSAPGGNALAQDAYCIACVDERWNALEIQLTERAQAVRTARELLRGAERRGDPAIVQAARTHLDNTLRSWNEIDASADAVGSGTYRASLVRNLVEVEASYDAARDEMHFKTEQFNRLRSATADQRARIVAELEGIVRDEARQRGELALEGVLKAIKAAALYAETRIVELQTAPDGKYLREDELESYRRAVELGEGADFIKVAKETSDQRYWQAGTELAQMGLEKLAKAFAPRLAGAAIAAGPIAGLTLDLALVGLSHLDHDDALARLDRVNELERDWQGDIAALGARVRNLEQERQMAQHTIERQEAFARNISVIQDEELP